MGAYHDSNRKFTHPTNADEVAELIARARKEKKQVRVAGSQHSEKGAIHSDDGIDLMLDQMRALSDPEDGETEGRKRIWVGAGCNLGKDPWDPSGTSKWGNSLNVQLEESCLALDALGGISHQSVAGFLLTGSSGGSTKYGAANNVVAIEYVDGRGNKGVARRGEEMFDALGVSMGLLGVVTRVQLEVGPNYDLEGSEETVEAADNELIDFFGSGKDGKPSLVEWLESEEYARVLWWPQYDLDRIQLWRGKRVARDPKDHRPFQILTPWDAAAGSFLMTVLGHRDRLGEVYPKLEAIGFDRQFKSAHDDEPDIDRNACLDPRGGASRGQMVQSACHVLGKAMTRVDTPAFHNATPSFKAKFVGRLLYYALNPVIKYGPNFMRRLVSKLLGKFLPSLVDEIVSQFVPMETKVFRDAWMCALPMDNQMDDQLWGTRFTEVFIEFEHAEAMMADLRDYFRAGDDKKLAYERTGPYGFELYAGPKSNFWLSPAYGGARLRFDPFWFELWGEGAYEAMEPFWKLLKKYNFRCHWGKILPRGKEWPAYWRKQYPKWDDFLALRKELDPDDVFLSKYWRGHLGL